MKTNHVLAGTLLLTAIVGVTLWQNVATGQQNDPRHSSSGGLQNGRFQLYHGSYEILNAPAGFPGRSEKSVANAVFKIDTATGRVWKYDEATSATSTSVKRAWLEIEGR